MLYAIVALLVIILDQWVKLWVSTTIQGNITAWSLIPNVLTLVNIKNDGAAFSFLSGSNATIIFVAIAGVVALLVIIALATRLVKGELGRWSLVFIAAGGLSNAIDRVMYHAVQDMIQLDFLKHVKFLGVNGINFPIFNIADIFITVFCVVFILYVIFGRRAEIAVGVLAIIFGALLAVLGLRVEGGKALLIAGGVIAALGLLFLIVGIAKRPNDGEKGEEEEPEEDLEDDDEEEEDERPLRRRDRKQKAAEEAPVEEAPAAKPKKGRQSNYEDDYERYKARKAKEAPAAPAEEAPVPVVDPGDPFAEWEKARASVEKAAPAPEDEGTVKMPERPKAAHEAPKAEPEAPKAAAPAPKAAPAANDEFSLEDILAEFR